MHRKKENNLTENRNELPLNPEFELLGVSFFSREDELWYHSLVVAEATAEFRGWDALVSGIVGLEPSIPDSLKADLPEEIQHKVVAAVHEAAPPAWKEFTSAIVRSKPPKNRGPRPPRMHNELPPSEMGKAVILHRIGGGEPDPAKALILMRETRDATDAFVEDFSDRSNQAIVLMRDPDRNLIGELMYMQYVATAVANRLDLVIADLEKEAKK